MGWWSCGGSGGGSGGRGSSGGSGGQGGGEGSGEGGGEGGGEGSGGGGGGEGGGGGGSSGGGGSGGLEGGGGGGGVGKGGGGGGGGEGGGGGGGEGGEGGGDGEGGGGEIALVVPQISQPDRVTGAVRVPGHRARRGHLDVARAGRAAVPCAADLNVVPVRLGVELDRRRIQRDERPDRAPLVVTMVAAALRDTGPVDG